MSKITPGKLIAGLLSLVLNVPLSAQNDVGLIEEADGWYRVEPGRNIDVGSFLQSDHLSFLGLIAGTDGYRLQKTQSDQLGMTHYRYQQTYKDVAIEGAELLIHSQDQQLRSMNGEIVRGMQGDPNPAISSAQAVEYARQAIGADLYLMDDSETLARFATLLGENAPKAPKPELIWADPEYSNNGEQYRLAYKMDIYALEPMSRHWVFIDARNGDLLYKLDRIHDGNTQGIAETRYHGTRTIYTDSLDTNLYRLRQSVTGGGVETYDMNQGTNYSGAVDFLDSNNYWDNVNPQQDEVATDAHWGARVTYEYFFDQFGRDSYDDQGSKLVSFVHYDQNYVNAFWNGQFMTYGDGNGAFGPLTPLDVVGHEIAHGVTGNSAGLIYRAESGALNESFSDIFGAAIEWLNDSADGDWIIGEEMNNRGLRDMSDPKPYGHPDTYRGQNWGYGVFIDNGYVHSNSGVQNYWFYLLTDGGQGVNDLGDAYVVDAIGVLKAGQIAYRNLNVYLTANSDHFDARQGSLQAARDLYGSCSQEEIAVSNAWYAVGVGEAFNENDLALAEVLIPDFICNAGQEDVAIRIANQSCANAIPAGDTLFLSYQVNGGALSTDSLILSSALAPGASLIHSFTAKADLSQAGVNRLSAFIDYGRDQQAYNDTLRDIKIENRPLQNTDFGILNILSPASECISTDSTDITLELYFNGCDSLDAGQTLNFELQVGNQPKQNISYTLQQSVYTQDTITISLANAIAGAVRGDLNLNLALANANDQNPANDAITNYSFSNPYRLHRDTLGFENFRFRDSLTLETSAQSRIDRPLGTGNSGFFSLQFSGGNALEYPEGIEFPTAANVWSVNPAFGSKACACVDATDMQSLQLNFDRRQEFSRIYRQVLRQGLEYASALRVTVNGNPVTGTFVANNSSGDLWSQESVDLSSYLGQEFQLCFETKTLMWRSFNQITGDADLVQLDNIYFNASYIGEEEVKSPTTEMALYPNPTAGTFYLENKAAHSQSLSLSLRDMTGRLIESMQIDLEAGQRYEMTTDLPEGSYLLEWVQDDEHFSEMLIIR